MKGTSNDSGVFVISIDFELLWGVWDVTSKENYGEHITGVKKVIPELLDLFRQFGLKATFATVGFLFARNRDELFSFFPDTIPCYQNVAYNVYKNEVCQVGYDESDDPYHFGHSLLRQIKDSPHEIGTHTFSHYYCLEEGQTAEEFDADIQAAKKIAAANGIELSSLVFPRNQINAEYLSVLYKNGISVFRGNPTSWIYKPRKFSAEVPFIRLCRLLDTYLPVSGYNTHRIEKTAGQPVNIPASHFLKPYNKSFPWLENLKLSRIKKEMTWAAQKGELFHLWWHPHNFGTNITENIANLRSLLVHYQELKEKYGFRNLTMKEAAGV